jgi:DNA polymerase-3 subunit epsilon
MPKLARPLAVIDLEGTSLEVTESRIVEFAVTVLNSDGSRRTWVSRFNPGVPIPPAATEIHGIRDEDVAGHPKFSDYAGKILKGLEGKDIAGYNLWQYDLGVLDSELRRCGLKLNLDGVNIIDVFGIFSNREPRNLEAAAKKYLGHELNGAHGAAVDSDATLSVLLAQLGTYPDLGEMSLAELAAASLRGDNRPADVCGKVYRKDGALYFAFGKNKDRKVSDDPEYAKWMLRSRDPGFPGSTCDALRVELERLGL